tara:strand:- start:86 stop:361 length:276 start_codon:yes stop_codon:yes gene_type:complete
MEIKMTNETERIGFTKDQMIEFLKIFKHNTDTMLEMEERNFENNKKYMVMEHKLWHMNWKFRYVSRLLRRVRPDLAQSEEELDEKIRRQES